MGWSIGYDANWERDVGYGVPSICDQPGCDARIDRGLSYVCGGEPYGGAHGCGLFFCAEHLLTAGRMRKHQQLCIRCYRKARAFEPKPDLPEWIEHKRTDPSWAEWRTTHRALRA